MCLLYTYTCTGNGFCFRNSAILFFIFIGYTPIRLSAIAKYSKQIEVNYDPTREKVRRCHIWLDFSKSAAAKYINGETYGLTLTAVSESDTATETIVIQTWVAPIPGLVEVRYHKTLENLETRTNCCNYPKSETTCCFHRIKCPIDADGMANSVDTDHTTLLGAV